jgi:hypothetical protein
MPEGTVLPLPNETVLVVMRDVVVIVGMHLRGMVVGVLSTFAFGSLDRILLRGHISS